MAANDKWKRKIIEQFEKRQPSKQEFKELIDLSTEICKRGLVNIAGLYGQYISRTFPTEMTAIMIQTENAKSWDQVTLAAGKLVWASFPEIETPILAAINKAERLEVSQYSEKKVFCHLHGEGAHKTSECRVIKQIEQAGWKRNLLRNINSGIVEEESDPEFNKKF